MAKLGTKERPIIVRVHSDEKARYVVEKCAEHGWQFIIGFEADKPEDISDLEKMLNPPNPVTSEKVARNDPCPCGSGKKYKKCCMVSGYASNSLSWQDNDGIHVIEQGEKPSGEKLKKMTKEYQEQIRKTPLWDKMVKEHGKKKAEELLSQFEVKMGE